jgi:hypothetical protein
VRGKTAAKHVKEAKMVIVDCPWCLGPVALGDEEAELNCDGCSISVEVVTDEVALEVSRAA